MKILRLWMTFFGLFLCLESIAEDKMENVYGFEVKTIEGKEISLDIFTGKVLLIVNTASKCGFTYQYEGLEKLYQTYREQGFEILGFPCNQFASQEPGTEQEIAQFCSLNYGVSFPMFSKLEVNGKNTHPLYQYLKSVAPGTLGSQAIKWNFTKFLIDREGKVKERFSPRTEPDSLKADIEKLL